MDPQDRELLHKTAELAEENNRLLRKIHRGLRLSRAVRIVYWVVIIGLSIGAYYYIQPFVQPVLDVYTGFGGSVDQVQNLLQQFGGNQAPR